jgi:CTP:phosphocholine cytidylyltransferase-like protein|tara:strand:- start:3448 stop:3648 length:201 start_codon:yes stop_codon:yes gene_type:complete
MGFLKENFLNKKAFLDVSDYNLYNRIVMIIMTIRSFKLHCNKRKKVKDFSIGGINKWHYLGIVYIL